MPKILVIGYGNPGRLDDGLGPALAARLEVMALPGVTVDSDYQLTVEDAAAVAQHDVVIFADAHVSCAPPFALTRLEPGGAMSFSTHHVEPGAVLALAKDLFGETPDAFALGIRGYEFNDFGERLSDAARRNLDAALEFLVPWLQNEPPFRAEEV
ncbi:MAG: hydrogenase maturation protease [Pseudomonadota bacterium]